MSGVKNKDEEKELRVDSATGTHLKRKRKAKVGFDNRKARAWEKKKYQKK